MIYRLEDSVTLGLPSRTGMQWQPFKKKRKRMSDGLKVVRVEIHPRIPRSTKRVLVNGTAVESDSPSHRVPSEKLRRSDSDSKVNIFANVIKAKETVTSSSHANTEKTAVRSGKTTIKRKHPYSADVAEIDGKEIEHCHLDNSYSAHVLTSNWGVRTFQPRTFPLFYCQHSKNNNL
ncbi:hypothetical protein KIN20_029559 [Parelaphostrongylus tenuis]|uniref:Uncharacterized protein n=1 Tax=Parelaphostrongylus tenuis TaxID=148309 RepID=A0AAD5R2Y9_PARTN|nr:hypothetical protein KIN20_029559 [Parelaphostrongylus tenuis]